jgi:uncharacterized protein YcbX
MPVVRRIVIFPIKALDPLECEEVELLPSGPIAGDRRFALFDAQMRYVNGKRYPAVHRLRVRYSHDLRTAWFRIEGESTEHRFDLYEQRAALEDWLSSYFGFAVVVKEDAAFGFPDDREAPGPTVIATATLQEVGSWFGLDLNQARGRFRANLEIGDTEPFWEDRLYGRADEVVRFRIGEVVLEGTNPCKRCVVPSRDPWTGEAIADFVARFVRHRAETLPVWAERSRFQDTYYRLMVNTRPLADKPGGRLRVGDTVEILGTFAK